MTAQRETVVLVHGLYVHGLWMQLLEYWLEEAGYHTVNYSYPSITRTPAENAEDLHALLEHVDTSVVHFLAHSMADWWCAICFIITLSADRVGW